MNNTETCIGTVNMYFNGFFLDKKSIALDSIGRFRDYKNIQTHLMIHCTEKILDPEISRLGNSVGRRGT